MDHSATLVLNKNKKTQLYSSIKPYYLGQVIVLSGVMMCSYFCIAEYYDHPMPQNDTDTTLF